MMIRTTPSYTLNYKTWNIIVLLFLIQGIVLGQTPNWSWAKSATGTNRDVGLSIDSDINGNSYITGNFRSTSFIMGAFTLTNSDPTGNTFGFYLAKYNASGTVVWAKTAVSTGDVFANVVKVDQYGNTYVVGQFEGPTANFGGITIAHSGGPGRDDIFMVKYDVSGNVVWAKKIGSSGSEIGQSLTLDPFGNIYITGSFTGTTNFGGGIIYSSSSGRDIFIAKYSNGGSFIWAKRSNSSSGGVGDYSFSVCCDNSGNPCITGIFNSGTISFPGSTVTLNNTAIGEDMFIIKYDVSGNLIWAKSAVGKSRGAAVKSDNFGNFYLSGNYQDTILYETTTLPATHEFFLAKYNSTGNLLWVKSGIKGAFAGMQNIDIDLAGNVYITGISNATSLIFDSLTMNNSAAPLYASFVIKLDANGNPIWGKTVEKSNGFNVSVDPAGDSYFVGSFNRDTVSFDSIDIANTNTGFFSDLYVAKLNSSFVGVEEAISNLSELKLFPNPTNDNLNLQIGNNESFDKEVLVEIRDIFGSLVFSRLLGDQERNINVSALKKGVYILNWGIGNSLRAVKFVKL
jgi:hypothetical protein